MLRELLNRLRPQKTTTVHDYTIRAWGHDFTITEVIQGGQQLKVMGWGHGLEKGHFLKLPNGPAASHYRIDKINYLGNPADMWSAVLTFPRKLEKRQDQ